MVCTSSAIRTFLRSRNRTRNSSVWRARHRRRAIIEQRRPGDSAGRPITLRLGQPQRGGFDDLELVDDRFAHAVDFQQALARRGDHFGEAAEAREQRLGQAA